MGKIKYSEALRTQQLNHIVKIQNRGKLENRGTWFELTLLLDFATWLDVDLWYEVYSAFIRDKILEKRDAGGENFKRLNKAINTLPDRQPHLKPKGNDKIFQNMAKWIRSTVFSENELNLFSEIKKRNTKANIWNTYLATDEHQRKRKEIEDRLSELIEIGVITSYPQLKDVTFKLLNKYKGE